MSNQYKKLLEDLEYLKNNPRGSQVASFNKQANWFTDLFKKNPAEAKQAKELIKLVDKANKLTDKNPEKAVRLFEQAQKKYDSLSSPAQKGLSQQKNILDGGIERANKVKQNFFDTLSKKKTKTVNKGVDAIDSWDPKKQKSFRDQLAKKLQSVGKYNKQSAKLISKLKPQHLMKAVRMTSPLAFLAGIAAEYALGSVADFFLDRYSEAQDSDTAKLMSDVALEITHMLRKNKKTVTPEKLLELVNQYERLTKTKVARRSGKQFSHEDALKEIANRENITYVALPNKSKTKQKAKNPEAPTPTAPKQTKVPAQPETSKKPAPAKFVSYTIQAGDSLSEVARKVQQKYPGVTWQDIFNANKDKISHPDKIQIGWKIRIPTSSQGTSAPAGYWKDLAKQRIEKQKQQAKPPQPKLEQKTVTPTSQPVKKKPVERKTESRPSAEYLRRKRHIEDQEQMLKKDRQYLENNPTNPVVTERYQETLKRYERSGDVQLYTKAIQNIPSATKLDLNPEVFIQSFTKNRIIPYVLNYRKYFKNFDLDRKWLGFLSQQVNSKKLNQTVRAMEIFQNNQGKVSWNDALQQAIK